MLQNKINMIAYSWCNFFSPQLSIKAKKTFLQYKVLNKSYNLKFSLVKSKINQESEKYRILKVF